MKLIILLIINFIFGACSSLPERNIASMDEFFIGEIEPVNSHLLIYPYDLNPVDTGILFKLNLKNNDKKYVDVDSSDIKITYKKKKIDFALTRLAKGQYTVEISDEQLEVTQLKFKIQGKTLKNEIIKKKKPNKLYSRLRILEVRDHEVVLELVLRDKNGHKIESLDTPEIIVEGESAIEDLKMERKGTWVFRMVYPDLSQIFYISVKANGSHLERILRYHYVHKED